jgi:hypothetical protein
MKMSATRRGRFTPGKRAPSDSHWIGSWVGPRGGLNAVEKLKIFCPCQESNPGRPARSPLLYQLNNETKQ